MLLDEFLEIAEKAGFERIAACCDVPGKFCANDVWRGNLAIFADALLRFVAETGD